MHILSVTDYIKTINEIISPIDELVIEGEVSGFSIRQNKWVFFSLKDESSVLECFSIAYRLQGPLEDGMKVRVYGNPSIYPKSGRFRFTVDKVEFVGEGALKKAYLALKKKLLEEGLFAPERKRTLPEFPLRIGFIGSKDSAAYTDFVRILSNRWSGVEVQLYDVRVQGDSAPDDIVRAFEFFNKLIKTRSNEAPEVLVLTRGGGSLEDLQAFNDERVARAIFASSIPVVCGVGHEKDESLADFVADQRASTPSNAAEIIVPERLEVAGRLMYFSEYFENTIDSMVLSYSHRLERGMQTLERHVERIISSSREAFTRFQGAHQRVVVLFDGVRSDISQTASALFERMMFLIETRTHAIGEHHRLLNNLNPARVLARGYSIVYDSNHRVVREKERVKSGDSINIRLAKGSLGAKVD